MIYRVYTIRSGKVEEGAFVGTYKLKGAGVEIPAITVGEEGRGRELGILPVTLLPELYEGWKKRGWAVVSAAEVTKTQTGRPKLIVREKANSDEYIIGVFLTKIGFRGGNRHTGDRTGEYIDGTPQFKDFPGEVLVKGTIAQGTAGRMGSGTQMVSLIPKGVVFRTAYSGRLYGHPPSHYYLWDGEKLMALTWEERQVSGLF